MKKVTAWDVNRELRKRGFKEKITQGRGYVYFRDGDAERWYSSSVPICYISECSVTRWLEEHAALRNDYRNH